MANGDWAAGSLRWDLCAWIGVFNITISVSGYFFCRTIFFIRCTFTIYIPSTFLPFTSLSLSLSFRSLYILIHHHIRSFVIAHISTYSSFPLTALHFHSRPSLASFEKKKIVHRLPSTMQTSRFNGFGQFHFFAPPPAYGSHFSSEEAAAETTAAAAAGATPPSSPPPYTSKFRSTTPPPVYGAIDTTTSFPSPSGSDLESQSLLQEATEGEPLIWRSRSILATGNTRWRNRMRVSTREMRCCATDAVLRFIVLFFVVAVAVYFILAIYILLLYLCGKI